MTQISNACCSSEMEIICDAKRYTILEFKTEEFEMIHFNSIHFISIQFSSVQCNPFHFNLKETTADLKIPLPDVLFLATMTNLAKPAKIHSWSWTALVCASIRTWSVHDSKTCYTVWRLCFAFSFKQMISVAHNRYWENAGRESLRKRRGTFGYRSCMSSSRVIKIYMERKF